MSQQPSLQSGPVVVGIGASAGGLGALKVLFSQVPPDSGLVFIVIVHLLPDQESRMAELLQPSTSCPVTQVREDTRLEPNHVYVIPPNANLNAIDTHLRLSILENKREERGPIDHFFRTLARAHGGNAIAVILTGNGSDGTFGLKEIKSNGGLVIVQDPNEADYEGMPESAVSSGLVDFVLPVAEIPQAILRSRQTPPVTTVPVNESELSQDERLLLEKVFAQLLARTDYDFTRYRKSRILQCIARRMQLNCTGNLACYLDRLRDRPEEAAVLADDLLDSASAFCLDSESFEQLRKTEIPRLFTSKDPVDSIRMWSVGCATGEEVYSLSILLNEEAARHPAPPNIQLFASDVRGRSLDRAREGFYSAEIETAVSKVRLQRYFQKQGGGYRISNQIRDAVVFAHHNVVADPPFAHLDLICCRNLLSYFDPNLHRSIVELFHYALNPGGVLLLESGATLELGDRFRIEDAKLGIFRKRNVLRDPRVPTFPLTREPNPAGETAPAAEKPVQTHSHATLHQQMIDRYTSPSILIGPDNGLLHLSPNVDRYLLLPTGAATSDAVQLVRKELRAQLKAGLRVAREQRSAFDSKPVSVRFDNYIYPVILRVCPAPDPPDNGSVLVIFEEQGPQRVESQNQTRAPGGERQKILQLEDELDLVQHRLNALVEEYQASSEEMKVTNEELQSRNEELHSTMEALNTSKEELQSMNEELQTVNQQLYEQIDTMSELTNDLKNLFAATEIATLFLDRELRIHRFTPRLLDLFNIRHSDRGRPIADFTHRIGYESLRQDAETVLRDLSPMEREIQDDGGHWYLSRILPYRGNEDRVEGVVLTFVDIDSRKLAEEILNREKQQDFVH